MVLPCPAWYRSNNCCSPGVLSCQTWYRSRAREYCGPGHYHVQHAFTFRGAAIQHGTVHVQGNTAVQGCYHFQHGTVHVQGNTAAQACYHATFMFKGILRSRGATMSNMMPFTFKGILRSRGCYHAQLGTVHVQENTPTWYRSRFVCFLDFGRAFCLDENAISFVKWHRSSQLVKQH